MKSVIILSIVFFSTLILNAQSDYYWYKGEKISLEKKEAKKYFVFENVHDSSNVKQLLKVSSKAKVLHYHGLNAMGSLMFLKEEKTQNRQWAIVEDNLISKRKLSGYQEVIYEANFYITKNGIEAGLSHLFYVKLNKEQDFTILEKIANDNGIEIIGNNKFMPLWYTLSCSKKSKGDALDMANLFYETNLFSASEPDLMTDDSPLCVNDPHFNDQWGLNNTGQNGGTNGVDINFCQARQITTGNANIIIAVLDHGVELNHPDLTNMHSVSFDSESGTSPSQVWDNHGTACAGIIGANSDNNLGVTGIAPNCPIMSISNKLTLNPNAKQSLANGLNFSWQNGASVISNSWGHNLLNSTLIDDAIDNALIQGRNGLGTIVVFATGNGNTSVSYPANSNADIIAVGALSPCAERTNPSSCDGEYWWGSNYGNELDVVAPGVFIPTTDRQGANGYNTSSGTAGNYDQSFNGTSSATPHVAAIAGLILSQNTHLTQQQVAQIIESTAQKIGGYSYQNTAGRPNGTWDHEVGYGLVDAYAALQMCVSTTIENQTISTDTDVEACDIYIEDVIVNNTNLNVNYRGNATIVGTFEVTLGTTLEITP